VADGFPRQSARTRRFTCGQPRSVSVAEDGSRVLFLRSGGGDDPVNCLWSLDPATGGEHLVADPVQFVGRSRGMVEVGAWGPLEKENRRPGTRGLPAAAPALSGRCLSPSTCPSWATLVTL
jgi:dipeptidyl-peptidase-4